MKLEKVIEIASAGPLVKSGESIQCAEGHIASTWGVERRRVSDCMQEGESWLDMRVRTQSARDACRPVAATNAALLAHWYNHGPKLLELAKELGRGCAAETTAIIEAAEEVEGI